jgi:hypothetical protein
LAPRAHDLVVFQIIDKIVGFGDGSKADRTKKLESIIDIFLFAHHLSPIDS